MAAGGWKIFTAGDVLTADDTMDYLQQGVLVFDSSGARGSAIASPVEGQFSYLKDTDSTEYYDGAAWTQVAQGGLVHIVTESFSAVSSVSLDNCFSGDYDNYRVLVGYASSGSLDLQMRMRLSGTDNTSSTYNSQMSFSYGSTSGAEANLGAALLSMGNTGTSSDAFITLDFYKPAIAANTIMVGVGRQHHSSVGRVMRSFALSHETATAYDGFSLIASANNMTGTVSVFGYKK